MDNTITSLNLRPEDGDLKNQKRLAILRRNSKLYHQRKKNDPEYKQKMLKNFMKYYMTIRGTPKYKEGNVKRQQKHREKLGKEEYNKRRREQYAKRKEMKNAQKMQNLRSDSQ